MSLITPQIRSINKKVELEVTSVFSIPLENILNRSRKPEYSRARFAIFFLLHKIHGVSLEIISTIYSYDISSVYNGVNKAIKYGLPESLGYFPNEKGVYKMFISCLNPVNKAGMKGG